MMQFSKIALVVLFLIGYSTGYSQTTVVMSEQSGVYTIPCTVNGLKLNFIFDTGASNVTISLSEALFMLKNEYLKETDIHGTSYAQLANGDITENTTIILREIDISGLKLYNVKASIIHELSAPLLLGQTAIQKLGKIQLDGNVMTIYQNTESTFSNEKNITKGQKRYSWNEVVTPNNDFYSANSVTYSKSDMKKINGIVYRKDSNDKLIVEFHMKDGKRNGLQSEWYSNGQIMFQWSEASNKQHGLNVAWYKNGTLWWKGNDINGHKEGLWKGWHENGQLHYEINYLNNKVVDQKCWNINGYETKCDF
jgi:clan AA aspartic protease (TIGR02281 family)